MGAFLAHSPWKIKKKKIGIFLETKSVAIFYWNITKMSIWIGTWLDKRCDGQTSGKGKGAGEEPLLEKAGTNPKGNGNLERYTP